MSYEVKLEIFQGPLDLLIHLIRKNEVDIFDIPIAVITDQYLEYIEILKALNITLAGDFLVMASTLLHIKSRMLLPELEESEEEDPRIELTRPLLEYLRLKEVAGELSERELLDRDVFSRRLSPEYRSHLLEGEEPVFKVNLFQLMDAFKRIVEENLPGASLKVQVEKWTIKDQMSAIMERLKKDGKFYFQDLFLGHKTVSEFIITFLSLLELVHVGLVRIFQSDPGKDIRLEGLFEQTEDNAHE